MINAQALGVLTSQAESGQGFCELGPGVFKGTKRGYTEHLDKKPGKKLKQHGVLQAARVCAPPGNISCNPY